MKMALRQKARRATRSLPAGEEQRESKVLHEDREVGVDDQLNTYR
jgi:hypothetical protein